MLSLTTYLSLTARWDQEERQLAILHSSAYWNDNESNIALLSRHNRKFSFERQDRSCPNQNHWLWTITKGRCSIRGHEFTGRVTMYVLRSSKRSNRSLSETLTIYHFSSNFSLFRLCCSRSFAQQLHLQSRHLERWCYCLYTSVRIRSLCRWYRLRHSSIGRPSSTWIPIPWMGRDIRTSHRLSNEAVGPRPRQASHCRRSHASSMDCKARYTARNTETYAV